MREQVLEGLRVSDLVRLRWSVALPADRAMKAAQKIFLNSDKTFLNSDNKVFLINFEWEDPPIPPSCVSYPVVHTISNVFCLAGLQGATFW